MTLSRRRAIVTAAGALAARAGAAAGQGGWGPAVARAGGANGAPPDWTEFREAHLRARGTTPHWHRDVSAITRERTRSTGAIQRLIAQALHVAANAICPAAPR